MTGRETLRPCPFCGGDAELHPTFWGLQPQTSCQCGGKVWAHSEEEAIARWNTRPSHDELVEALEAAIEAMTCRGDDAHYCPNCDRSSFDAREAARTALSHARSTDGDER